MLTVGRLPHAYPADRWLFITWHSYGSLPASQYPMPHNASAGQAFVWIDRQLDWASSGPVFLRRQAIAQLIQRGVQLGHYRLGAFVIMANQVNVLLWPLVDPSHLLQYAERLHRPPSKPFTGPVEAGLVARSEDYPWSSAYSVARSGDAARTSAYATTTEPLR
jgi:hypothetical protein